MNNKRYQRICTVCGVQYWTRAGKGKYCNKKCQNYAYNHTKAKRMSNKLTPEQREVMIALQEYFIRDKEVKP